MPSLLPRLALPASPAPTSIPTWSTAFSYGGASYPVTLVGTDPSAGPATTTIPVHIVPLKLTFASGAMFDASGEGAYVAASPIFKPARFVSGTSQFGDAVMRAEFWNAAGSESWHVLLAAPAIEPTQSVSVPADEGSTAMLPNGMLQGMARFGWFTGTVEPGVVTRLGIPPSALTIFVTMKVKLIQPDGVCCFSGYHSVWTEPAGQGTATFTAVWGSASQTSVDTLSHEVAEWLNDPFYGDIVPKWKDPTTGICGGDLFEVGDPLTRSTFYAGGFMLQDVAFYSWFARQSPSMGFGGMYDLRGVLTAPAKSCT